MCNAGLKQHVTIGYALELGISIPNKLAIMGFDDIENAASSSVPLTTVRQPFLKMAEKAVLLLQYYMETFIVHFPITKTE